MADVHHDDRREGASERQGSVLAPILHRACRLSDELYDVVSGSLQALVSRRTSVSLHCSY
jgi:hypothetical protein